MRRATRFSIVAIVGFAGFMAAQAAQAAVLNPAGNPGGWTVVEGINSGFPANSGIRAINGDGLDGTETLHDPGIYDNWGPVWFTQLSTGNPSINTWAPNRVWLMVDMQAVKSVGAMDVWNFGDPATHPLGFNLGAKNIDIWYAGTGATIPTTNTLFVPDGTWTFLLNTDLNPAPTNFAPSLKSDSIDFADFSARYVLISVNSRFGSNSYSENSVAIAEIQFLEGAAETAGVPEPSTFVLASLGLVGLGFVALRKKFHRA